MPPNDLPPNNLTLVSFDKKRCRTDFLFSCGSPLYGLLLYGCSLYWTLLLQASAVFSYPYKKIYFATNKTVSTYISMLIFFSFALPVIRFTNVQEITPMAIPSEML